MRSGEPVCPFAYHAPNGESLRCKAMAGRQNFCVFQFFCERTRRFEIRKEAANCGIKKSKEEGGGKA